MYGAKSKKKKNKQKVRSHSNCRKINKENLKGSQTESQVAVRGKNDLKQF